MKRRLYLAKLLRRAPREALALIAQETGHSYPATKKGKAQAMTDLGLDRETIRGLIAHYDEQADALLAQYGSGSRPSWVGAEVAMHRENARRYRELEAQLHVQS